MQHHKPELVQDLPPQYLLWMQHLKELEFGDRPNYELIKKYFTEMLYEAGGNENSPLDWEKAECKQTVALAVPSLYDSCMKKIVSDIGKYEKGTSKLSRELKTKVLNVLLRTHSPKFPDTPHIQMLLDSEGSELDLKNHKLTPAATSVFTSNCKSITRITLSGIDDTIIAGFLPSNFDTLEKIILNSANNLTVKSFNLLQQCYQLRSVSIQDSERITDEHLVLIVKNCPYLKELAAIDCKKVKGSLFKKLTAKKAPITALNSIDLSCCPISKKSFKAMIKFASNLTTIKLNPFVTRYVIQPSEIISLIAACRNLQVLELVTFRVDLDQILVEISQQCTKLTSLSVDGNGITDLGLQNIVQ